MTSGDPLLARLRSLAAGSPELAGVAAVYEVVLPLVRDADLRTGPIDLSREVAEARLSSGEPLLGDPLPAFDGPAAGRLLSMLADALAAKGTGDAPSVARALAERRVPVGRLIEAVARGNRGAMEAAARGNGFSREYLLTIARYAVRPAFRCWGEEASALFPDGPRWERGACWVCGDPALLAELRGNGQARHLRCGRCGSSWGYPRLACVHCGSEDRSARGVLLPEGGPGTPRVETCRSCRGYLKTVVSHDPTPVDFLFLRDLETLPLDFLARARGYERYPSLS